VVTLNLINNVYAQPLSKIPGLSKPLGARTDLLIKIRMDKDNFIKFMSKGGARDGDLEKIKLFNAIDSLDLYDDEGIDLLREKYDSLCYEVIKIKSEKIKKDSISTIDQREREKLMLTLNKFIKQNEESVKSMGDNIVLLSVCLLLIFFIVFLLIRNYILKLKLQKNKAIEVLLRLMIHKNMISIQNVKIQLLGIEDNSQNNDSNLKLNEKNDNLIFSKEEYEILEYVENQLFIVIKRHGL
jgi:hypothetical protein